MANFNVGDLVIGTRSNHTVARNGLLCVVTQSFRWSSYMKVAIVGGPKYYAGLNYEVYKSNFDAITLDEYKKLYPNAFINYGEIGENNLSEANVQLHMDMSKRYEIGTEEKNELIDDVCNWLKEVGRSYTRDAVERIIDEWVKNKGWIIEIFKKHPNYNGKYQIVFDQDYQRGFDFSLVNKFSRWIANNNSTIISNNQVKVTAYAYNEAKRNINRIKDIIEYFDDIKHDFGLNATINRCSKDEFVERLEYFKEIIDIYNTKQRNGEIVIKGNYAYSKEAYEIFVALDHLAGYLSEFKNKNLTETDVEVIKAIFKDKKINAVAGRKLSRMINEIMHYTGMSDLPEYEKAFADYSDAVNPVAIKRFTVLSVHPIDYLTMSNGNSWSSCHSVVKHGGYNSGTISYMLDPSSFVYYTVDKRYKGNTIEREPKITRCMFHMGNERLVQGRVYPQNTDKDADTYLVIRNIVRRVLSTAMNIADDWTIRKGTANCISQITSHGTHYRDYNHVDLCNVSRIKRKDAYQSNKKITVGADPICIKCGKRHRRSEINCCY